MEGYDEPEPVPRGEGVASFRLATKADEGTEVSPILGRITRLYKVERKPEHYNRPGVDLEPLHCDLPDRFFVGDEPIFRLEGLFGQWYKFAFVSLPDVTGMEIPGEYTDFRDAIWKHTAANKNNKLTMTEDLLPDLFAKLQNGNGVPVNKGDALYQYECDFAKLYVNYAPVLLYQHTKAYKADPYKWDLAAYRASIDRWVDPGNPLEEKVSLTRVTGELVFDLGVPADQFEYPVKKVEIEIPHLPDRFYIRDGADSVWTIASTHFPEVYKSFFWNVASDALTQNTPQSFTIALLPDTLENAKVTITFGKKREEDPDLSADKETIVMDLCGGTDEAGNKRWIRVRRNARTRVRYNGVPEKWFEIRYAGFDGTEIDVDEDRWDGNG